MWELHLIHWIKNEKNNRWWVYFKSPSSPQKKRKKKQQQQQRSQVVTILTTPTPAQGNIAMGGMCGGGEVGRKMKVIEKNKK